MWSTSMIREYLDRVYVGRRDPRIMASLSVEETKRLLRKRMTSFWAAHCFVRASSREWIRRWGWKSDRVRAVHLDVVGSLINFEVLIPPPRGVRFDEELVGIVNLEALSRAPISKLRIPMWGFLRPRFVERIMALMPLAVEWFARYQTAVSCLKQLPRPNFNPDSERSRYCVEYLSGLPDEANRGCCLLHLGHEYPNDYSRSIFDIHHRGLLPKPKDSDYA